MCVSSARIFRADFFCNSQPISYNKEKLSPTDLSARAYFTGIQILLLLDERECSPPPNVLGVVQSHTLGLYRTAHSLNIGIEESANK